MAKLLPVGRAATVQTPATTANLGPGFDSLGLALNWADTVHAETIDNGLQFELTGEGSTILPQDGSHLVVSTLLEALETWDLAVPGLRLQAHNTIPLTRGLGSSSAAIVAGLGLAWRLAHPKTPLDVQWALDRAIDIEGHADNVGPAILGGFTIAWDRSAKNAAEPRVSPAIEVISAPVHPSVRITALIPKEHLETEGARQVLPAKIPFAHAVQNTARSALLVHALGHEPSLLSEATADWLHQDYRADLYPRSHALVEALRAKGFGAAISGAGPAVIVLHTADQSEPLLAALGSSSRPEISEPGIFIQKMLTPGPGLQVL